MLAPAEPRARPLEHAAASVPGHVATTLRIVRRELAEKLGSAWLALLLTMVFLGVYAYGAVFQRTFETESVLVSRDPLLLLNAGLAGALGVVLGLRLSASIAWEREHRTLEVLLVGPATWPTLVLAKYLSEIAMFALIAVGYLAYLLVAQPMGPGVTGLADAGNAVLVMIQALPFLGFGLLISAFSRTVRMAVMSYIGLVLLFAAFDAAHAILTAVPPEDLSLAALYGRAATEFVAPIAEVVSPTSGLAAGVRAFLGDASEMVRVTGQSIGLCVVLLLLAMMIGRKRGVGR